MCINLNPSSLLHQVADASPTSDGDSLGFEAFVLEPPTDDPAITHDCQPTHLALVTAQEALRHA